MNITSTQKSAPTNREDLGPLDIAEIADPTQYINFGSILIPANEQLEVRLDFEGETDRLISLSIDYQGSTLQLQAFAAPKSEGIWLQILDQLKSAVTEQSGEFDERLGTFGPELVSKMRLLDAAGKAVGTKFARFIGVDGPRWFLRGVVSGAALTDPAVAQSVDALFRRIAVDRGNSAVPPKELLDLKLPPGVIVPPRAATRRA